jgi:hypothetical protein
LRRRDELVRLPKGNSRHCRIGRGHTQSGVTTGRRSFSARRGSSAHLFEVETWSEHQIQRLIEANQTERSVRIFPVPYSRGNVFPPSREFPISLASAPVNGSSRATQSEFSFLIEGASLVENNTQGVFDILPGKRCSGLSASQWPSVFFLGRRFLSRIYSVSSRGFRGELENHGPSGPHRNLLDAISDSASQRDTHTLLCQLKLPQWPKRGRADKHMLPTRKGVMFYCPKRKITTNPNNMCWSSVTLQPFSLLCPSHEYGIYN